MQKYGVIVIDMRGGRTNEILFNASAFEKLNNLKLATLGPLVRV